MPDVYETKSQAQPSPREENLVQSIYPFCEASRVTELPDDLTAKIFLWKGLTYHEIWQLLKEEGLINNTAVNALKSNQLWQPLFKEFFSDEAHENYYLAFRQKYESLLEATKGNFKAIIRYKRLQTDREFVLEVVKSGQRGILNYAIELRKDWEIALEGLKHTTDTKSNLSPDEYESNTDLPVSSHPVIEHIAAISDDNARVTACEFHLRQLKTGQTPHLAQVQTSQPQTSAPRTNASFFDYRSNNTTRPSSEHLPSSCLIA